jgi:hypothetical protein
MVELCDSVPDMRRESSSKRRSDEATGVPPFPMAFPIPVGRPTTITRPRPHLKRREGLLLFSAFFSTI